MSSSLRSWISSTFSSLLSFKLSQESKTNEKQNLEFSNNWKQIVEEVRLEFQTDSCPSLPKLFGVLLQSRECVFSAIILSLTRGTFWIYFRDYYNRILSSKTKTNKEKRNESINCSKIFEILIRFKSVLRLGIKLLGVQEFGDFFHVILSAQVAHLNEIQTDPTSSPCKFRNTVFCILLLPFHIIRTLVNINNSSSGNRSLNALKLTKSLKCIFDAFIQDRFLAISRCLQDEEILNACIKLIVVTICFATNLPRAFFSEAGLVQSFFLFVSIIANACIEDRTETEHDTCTVSDLRTLRKREKTEELKEEEEEEEHKFPAQLSDFYSSVTHPLFRSYTLTQGGREHITRLVLIFMLFLKFFEKTLRMVFEENTKPLAFAINQIVKLIVRDEIVSFWDYEHTSRSSALHVVAKILPFKKFLDWVSVFEETKLNTVAKTWINLYEKNVDRKYQTPDSFIGDVRNFCAFDIVSYNFEYGNFNVCFNPSCVTGSFETKRNVQCLQCSTSNNIVRFLKANNDCSELADIPILQQCSGCSLVQYCSKACQNQDWPYHKTHCKETRNAKQQTPSMKICSSNCIKH